MVKFMIRLTALTPVLMAMNFSPLDVAQELLRSGHMTASAINEAWAAASLNVKKFGAKGDGIHDDSAAIAAALNAARPGDTVSFPSGTFICNNVEVINKNNLTIKGKGNATIIRNGHSNGADPILTFSAVSGLKIQNLAFDNRAINAFGGVRFYDTENVLIDRTHFFDSAPLPVGNSDRYAFVFGNGSRPHKNIQITDNLIEDLQLEVDFGQGVTIQNNTVKRSVKTGAIGLFTVDDGVVLENYSIDGNTIIDPVGAAVAINIDPPDNINVTFRNITITNNNITFNRIPTETIHVGPADSSVGATGNLYDTVVVQNNLIQVAAGAGAQPAETALIHFNAGPNSGLNFSNVIIAQNQIQGGGDPAMGIVAMNLRYLANSTVNANTVSNMFTVLAFNQLLGTKIEQNYVGQLNDYPPYVFDNSRGNNLFQNNYYSGSVTSPLSYENGDPTDVIFAPLLSTQTAQSAQAPTGGK